MPHKVIQFRDRTGRGGMALLALWLLVACQPLLAQTQEVLAGDSDGCTGPAPQSHNESFRFTRSEEHDAFTRSVAPGAVIGSIRFVRHNVFNMEDPRESNWLYGTANKLNVITWESVLRDQLLVTEGDSYNASRLAESERLLRDLDFIYDARVRPWRVCGDVVDLEVITRDTWTLSLEVGVSRSGGNDEYSLGLSDSNIFGSGKEVGFLREKDDDRSGYTFFYNDPALLGSRWRLNFTYSDNDDGYYRNLEVERPFFSVYEEWSAGAHGTQGKFEQATWFRGDEVTEFNQEYEIFNAFGGIAVDIHEDERVGRWLFGLYHETNEFSFSDSNIPPD